MAMKQNKQKNSELKTIIDGFSPMERFLENIFYILCPKQSFLFWVKKI